jgi:predicted DNA-binding transcriptional regulator AlpA
MAGQVEYEFLFVVDGVSVDDDGAVAVLTDAFDGVLSWNRGLHRLAVSSQGSDALDAFRKLLARITSEVPTLRVLRVDPDLVGVSDIAERTGHSRQNIQQWVNGERNADRPFPSPEGCAGRSLIWRWAEVNEWLKPLGFDDQATRPTREECVFLDAALIEWNYTRGGGEVLGRELLAWRAGAAVATQSHIRGSLAQSSALTMHHNLLARVPAVTGQDLLGWFRRLEAGPAFLRLEERSHWLADEYGINHGYANAIVHEFELRRRVRLGLDDPNPAEVEAQPPTGRRP